MTTPVHWGWGVAGGAALGMWYGDSWTETAAGALLGSPWGSAALARGTHGTYRVGAWALSTSAGTAVRGLAWRAAGFAGSAALAVAGPVAVGYAASYAIAGRKGTDDFTDFLTLQVSPSQYIDALTLKSLR